MDMKTVKEWLEGLEEPYRSQAFENVEELNVHPGGVLFAREESLSSALIGAFDWGKSPQGHKYWENIYEKAFI